MARKIRGFWFRLCGFLLATFCVVGAGKTAYAKCDKGEECENSACCDKLSGLQSDDDDNSYNKYTCEKYRGDCYLQGKGEYDTNAYLEDDAGKFYYKTVVYCAPDGNWVSSS